MRDLAYSFLLVMSLSGLDIKVYWPQRIGLEVLLLRVYIQEKIAVNRHTFTP